VIIPPTGNETISMLKTSSLASVISLTELLLATENIYSGNFKEIPLLMVASIWYAAMTSVLYIGQYYLERYYARGSMRELPATALQRIRRGLFSFRHGQ
jgi:polar amino acid transport system permease protein